MGRYSKWAAGKIRSGRGFSLVEILTVIFVIAALAIFSYLSTPTILAKAKDAKRKGDIRGVALAIEEYREDTNCYPQAIPLCGNPLGDKDSPILSNIPCDPGTQNSYVYVSEGGDCPSWFQLYGNLEYTKDAIIDKVGCREGCGPNCQFNYGAASTNIKLNPYCEEASPSPPPPGDEGGSGEEGLPQQYVCAPGGACEVFANPELSGCPDIYPDDPTCQDACTEKENWCHDSRGKTN